MSDLSDLMALERERAKLEAQRDELLAALEACVKDLKRSEISIDWQYGQCRTEEEFESGDLWSQSIRNAVAIIAKAKGGQP